MSSPAVFELLLVSTDYQILAVVTRGAKQFGGNLGFVPTIDSARDYLGRRKVDGVFVDLDLPGARELMLSIRDGMSNRNAVVLACVPGAAESPIKLVSGANFILQKPLSEESVVSFLNAARDMMARERRRYFRHPVNVPVYVTADGKEQRAMMTDVSEGGMAVRLVKPVEYLSTVDFSFELLPGETIRGKGLVAWANNQGMIGVKFQFLRGTGTDVLHAWISQRENVSSLPLPQPAPNMEPK